MLAWVLLDPPDRAADPALYWWVHGLLVCNGLSLVIDTSDVVRFAAGDRQPHYYWNQSTDRQENGLQP